MKVISIASAKGGVGKSTLAVNLACAILEEGRSVAILDLDPQGSALLWQQIRTKSNPEASAPAVHAATAEALDQQLQALASRRVDFVVLDMPGYSSEELNRALQHCDVVLVPSRASIIDIAPATETVKAAMQLGRTFCYVFNFVPANDKSAFKSVRRSWKALGYWSVLFRFQRRMTSLWPS